MSKKSKSKNGSSPKAELATIHSSISIARGYLATLSLEHKSDWMRKYKRTHPLHLRMLLREVMEEIWNAQEATDRLVLKSHRPKSGSTKRSMNSLRH